MFAGYLSFPVTLLKYTTISVSNNKDGCEESYVNLSVSGCSVQLTHSFLSASECVAGMGSLISR